MLPPLNQRGGPCYASLFSCQPRVFQSSFAGALSSGIHVRAVRINRRKLDLTRPSLKGVHCPTFRDRCKSQRFTY